jgi:hypothetical protein
VRKLASPPKTVRIGLKKAFRTKRVVNLSHAILGFKAETGEMLQALTPYLLGYQITPDAVLHAKEEAGDALFFLTLASDSLKVKLPHFNRKVRTKDTVHALLLYLDGYATDMLDVLKKSMYGAELDEKKLAEVLPKAINTLYSLSWSLFGVVPAALVEQNVAKLKTRYPAGFTTDRALKRNRKNETTAMRSSAPI